MSRAARKQRSWTCVVPIRNSQSPAYALHSFRKLTGFHYYYLYLDEREPALKLEVINAGESIREDLPQPGSMWVLFPSRLTLMMARVVQRVVAGTPLTMTAS